MYEKYKADIEGILQDSDLSTITTKKIRRALEERTGTSLDAVKKEVNTYIEEIFINFKPRQPSPPVLQKPSPLVLQKPKTTVVKKPKKEPLPIKQLKTPATIKKKTPTKKKAPKERKPTDWPILKVSPPLSDIIHTDLCSRPLAVKKMWEYIREHKLQQESDKRMINCDANFKALCDGADEINTFTMNKYTQKYFESIPKEEQPKYKEIVAKREEAKLKEETK